MKMEAYFFPRNITLSSKSEETDFFAGIFAIPLINWLAIFSYLIGYIGISGIAMVIWFERSGKAGHHR